MSRLIVKNLPKNIKEERMNQIFGEMGQITDMKLKYARSGVFRRFAFVGYKTQTEAQRALKHFDKTFIDTSKIQVDICKDIGDDSAPRPWSKYSEKSSAFQKKLERKEQKKRALENGEEAKEDGAKKKAKKDRNGVLDELENDNGFQAFLEVHKTQCSKQSWANDEQLGQLKKRENGEESTVKEKLLFEDSSDSSIKAEGEDKDEENDQNSEMHVNDNKSDSNEASNVALSDMDYLKKKVTTRKESDHSTDIEQKDKTKKKTTGNNTEQQTQKHKNGKSNNENNNNNDDKNGKNKDSTIDNFERKSEFTVKLRGLPFHAKKKDITEFLSPLKIVDIRLTKDSKNRPSGRAYVDLETKKDMKEALTRNKDYIKGRYIEVFEDKRITETKKHEAEIDPPWAKNAEELAENKDLAISETGRLYLRNLSYTCTEEELSELFGKYGPTTEVFLPIDKHTNKSMGFAFITFMMPEHAMQAFSELDGHVFQGRMLHILPAKPKKNADSGEVVEEGNVLSYKKKQRARVSSLKGNDHNWNTLFLGVNAVAEIMADKYNSSKGDILDVKSKDGLALRMALGETQVVAETREFLTKHGVKLDAFGHPDAKRSKRVILVKNLQHGTTADDLEKLFSQFGHLGRVILPPSGVTALVEFTKLSTASKAFEKIAYTKFKNVPLYLEWAPADVLDQPKGEDKMAPDITVDEQKETLENSESESTDTETDGHVVFVKDLNFDTDENALIKLFSDVGQVKRATIAKKKDFRNKGNLLSMGYGFVEFKTKKDAVNAVKELQNFELDEHNLKLKMSNKKQLQETVKKKSPATKQKSSKILVRNVPFEATQKELRELFGTFGELKTVRLPKKLSGTGPHRGFAFIDFLTKQDAKRAFKSLCTSTHLYGRRLVLEWAQDDESVEELRKKTADYFHESAKKKKTKDFLDELDEE